MADDPVILSYYDCLLHESDRKLLNPGQWLNDNLIEFAFEYFSHSLFEELSEKVLFVPPATTQFLKMAPQEASVVLDPLDFTNKSFAFFAVNDNESNAAGGSHWSLLFYSSLERTAFHIDSWSASNQRHASQLTKTLGKYLTFDISMRDVECPQQTNHSDCGVYVICFCELIARHLTPLSKTGDDVACWIVEMQPQNANEKRKNIFNLISNLG